MNQLVLILLHYKYIAIFPLAVIGGPITALVIGFLVSMGQLEFIPAYGIMLLGDLIPDSIYYYIGLFGDRNKLIKKYTSKIGIISNNLKIIERLWKFHGKKTMFLSKLAYGLTAPFLVSAGLVGMPFKKFILYTIPVTIFQYTILLGVGYYLGQSYELAIVYVENTSIAITIILLIFVFGYALFTKFAQHQILKMKKNEEER